MYCLSHIGVEYPKVLTPYNRGYSYILSHYIGPVQIYICLHPEWLYGKYAEHHDWIYVYTL